MDMNSKTQLTIGIAGLGLIGGSIAAALKLASINGSNLVGKIIAFDKNIQSLEKAKAKGVINTYSSDGLGCFAECDVVFICLPVEMVATAAKEISKTSKALLTDVGSTKSEILRQIEAAGVERFIGGHPMAGSERVGFDAASALLLENAIYVICTLPNEIKQHTALLELLIKEMGAIPVRMDPITHDHDVSVISHLPHMVASTLCTFAAAEKDKMVKILSAGGFKDITRIASSNPEMWTDIAMNSREALLPTLRGYIRELSRLADSIEANDFKQVHDLLEKGRDYRNSVAISGRGILQGLPEIRVEVSDKPGVIAKITTILGNNNINVQNVNIQNNRAYEGGSMRLTLQNAHDKEIAVKLLTAQGFVCFE